MILANYQGVKSLHKFINQIKETLGIYQFLPENIEFHKKLCGSNKFLELFLNFLKLSEMFNQMHET